MKISNKYVFLNVLQTAKTKKEIQGNIVIECFAYKSDIQEANTHN